MRRTLFALALVATAGLACGKADTVLRVTLDPVDTSASPVTWLASQVAIGDESRTMDINSPDGQPLDLSAGTSYTVEISHTYSGAATVFVAALDDANTVVLNGSGSLPELAVGQLNDIEVVWQAPPTSP